ncbi:unnamed protein product [Brassica rapa subsp. narinosa]
MTRRCVVDNETQSIDVEDPAKLLLDVMGNEGATSHRTTINHEPPEVYVMSSESHAVIHRDHTSSQQS